jgi:hypothetical protein
MGFEPVTPRLGTQSNGGYLSESRRGAGVLPLRQPAGQTTLVEMPQGLLENFGMIN